MLRWRWPAVLLLPVLLTSCSYIAGVSAFASRPTCAALGAMPEREPTPKEMEDQKLLNADCYFRVLVTEKDNQTGWVKGHNPTKDDIRWNLNQPDAWLLKQAVRRMTDPEDVPSDLYPFRVTNVDKVMVNSVAYFVKEPKSEALTFLTNQEVCERKGKVIQETLDRFYRGDTIKVPAELKKECPNIKDEYKSKE